jgi:hypothetical protein
MGHRKTLHAFVACLLTGVSLLAGATQAVAQGDITPAANPAAGSEQTATFADPFAYCAALGTIDMPDSRYTGPKVPEAVAQGLRKAVGAPADAALEPFLHHTFWRCMDGRVYACTVGANLPCQERADVSRTPTQGLTKFCQENPHGEVVPAFVTGRATVYEWKRTNGVPEVVRQFAQPDAQGFLSNVWHAITPN